METQSLVVPRSDLDLQAMQSSMHQCGHGCCEISLRNALSRSISALAQVRQTSPSSCGQCRCVQSSIALGSTFRKGGRLAALQLSSLTRSALDGLAGWRVSLDPLHHVVSLAVNATDDGRVVRDHCSAMLAWFEVGIVCFVGGGCVVVIHDV